MAQTLEGMGITCKHGTVHMAYILDRHFSLENPSIMLGRTADDLRSAGQPSPAEACLSIVFCAASNLPVCWPISGSDWNIMN